MKAITFSSYGSPDILELIEIEKPTPKAEELLVRVHAASVNSLDWRRMAAKPFLVRLGDGLFKPKNPLLGADISGRVEAVGGAVTRFKPGDAVYGDISAGAFAEYACSSQKNFVHKPETVSDQEAAAVPVAGLTALQGLRDAGQIRSGQKVLVNGASGGVGHFAVQIARSYGAEVTGVCSTAKMSMVSAIGADHVVDYTKEDFTRSGQQYDLIYDAAGNVSVSGFARSLAPGGRGVVAGFTTIGHLLAVILAGKWAARRKKQWIGLMKTAYMDQEDLNDLSELLVAGQVKPYIDRTHPLREAGDALAHLMERRVQGKVVIVLADNPGA